MCVRVIYLGTESQLDNVLITLILGDVFIVVTKEICFGNASGDHCAIVLDPVDWPTLSYFADAIGNYSSLLYLFCAFTMF